MKTRFIRLLSVENKEQALLQAVGSHAGPEETSVFEVDANDFRRVPGSPFAYWVTDDLLRLFADLPPLDFSPRTAKQGMGTSDDFRFVRNWWAVSASGFRTRWFPFAKGGAFSRFYADVNLLGNWLADGVEVYASGATVRNAGFYFRPGLTWSDRTTKLFSARIWPAGGVFSVKGSAGFFPGDEFFALGLLNSLAFNLFLSILVGAGDAAARSYQIGVISVVPWPRSCEVVARAARRGWSIKRDLDTRTETSHAFFLPAILQVSGATLGERVTNWVAKTASAERELATLQATIDDRCFELYGISDADRRSINEGFGEAGSIDGAAGGESQAEAVDEEEGEDIDGGVTINPNLLTTELVSWTMGIAMGRFDARLAAGDQQAPVEPNPFDPLPACSPGMLTGEGGVPLTAPPTGYPIAFPADGVLVDDPGHTRDANSAVRSAFEVVFGTDGDARWREAGEILDPSGHDLRAWLSRQFFEWHIARYSKSRRKSPIYWQLGIPSGRYSVWLYAHRVTKDRLFQVLKDVLRPKLTQEQGVLERFKQEAGAIPTQSQRRAIESQEAFIAELKTFVDEVARVAPLWAPDLDDGVVICLAPLWRLFPQCKAWQRECKRVWDALVAGDYDWTHLAMHIWPERVVPKCQSDRSLAIAHGLEEVFWEQDDKDKWVKRKPPEATGKTGWQPTIERLVAERTSRQVKDALANLLAAPTAEGGSKRGRRSQATTESAANGEAARAGTKRRGKTAKARDESEELF